MSFSTSNPRILTLAKIPDGDRGIRETVYRMRKEMNLARQDPQIAALVQRIISESRARTQTKKSQALVSWFMQNIRYATDDQVSMTEKGPQFINIHQCPTQFHMCEPIELLYRPERLFRQRFGDCDDFSMALGVMHELAGIQVKIKVVAADPTNPREYSHVYILVNADGSWIPVDAVNRSQPWGWEVPNPARSEVVV